MITATSITISYRPRPKYYHDSAANTKSVSGFCDEIGVSFTGENKYHYFHLLALRASAVSPLYSVHRHVAGIT